MYVKMDGPLVRRMRGSRGFDVAYFARKAGISPKRLRRVERNGGPVRRETARKIGAALDVNPRTLARAILSRPA